MKKLQFAILGAGRHTIYKLLPAFAESESAEVIAIGSLSGYQHENIPSYSYEEAVDKADAVCISLPNHMHAEWCIKALEAGKDVLCEKPATLSYAEAREVEEVAKKTGKKVFEAFMYRFHPQHLKAKELIAAGEIGKVTSFESRFHYFLDDYDNIRLKRECGGGALLDVGCYIIDAARFVLGSEPEAVNFEKQIDPKSGVDVITDIKMQFPSDVSASGVCGCQLEPRERWYKVHGTKGSIHVRDAYNIPRNKKALIEVNGTQHWLEPCNHYVSMIDWFCRWINNETVEKCFQQDFSANMKYLEK